ncbi:hypothetical protein ACC675_37930, partial [Rhizobium ruizarguesonis]
LWLVGNALIAVGIPLFGDSDQPIAWDAHIGGFVFGFLLFSLFDRAPRPPDISLQPSLSYIGLSEFHRAGEAIERGYEEA